MATSPLLNKKFLLVYISCWFVFEAVQSWIIHELGYDLVAAVNHSVVSGFLLAASGFLISNILGYYRPGKWRYLYFITWGICIAALTVFFEDKLVLQLLPHDPEYLAFMERSQYIRFSLSFLVIGWVTMLSWMWYNIEDQKENERRKIAAEKMAKEAELFNLRQQLQPHFLFNSLNSISALAGSKPQEARNMIQQLSDFLRGTLKKEDQQQVQLKEELQHLQLYLDIEKVRFGHRLETAIDCKEQCLTMIIPQLLLQPIVENAIKFGLYDTTDNVTISIVVQCDQDHLAITVSNPFDPATAPKNGTGFGLKSVQRRLYLLYARNDLLETKAEKNKFITIVKIPQLA